MQYKVRGMTLDDSKIDSIIKAGRHDRDWYQHTESLFVWLYGRDKLITVCNLFAATSINSSLESNVRLFRRALYEIENNLPVGKYLPNIRNQITRIRNGEELSGRKIRSFARAMSGGVDAVVVDIWLLRAFNQDRQYKRHTGPHAGTIRSGGATPKQYDAIETYVRDRAYDMSIQPRQLSAIIWSGCRGLRSGKMTSRYDSLLIDQAYSPLFQKRF